MHINKVTYTITNGPRDIAVDFTGNLVTITRVQRRSAEDGGPKPEKATLDLTMDELKLIANEAANLRYWVRREGE